MYVWVSSTDDEKEEKDVLTELTELRKEVARLSSLVENYEAEIARLSQIAIY